MDNKNFNFPDDKIFQYITYGIVLAFILFNLESVWDFFLNALGLARPFYIAIVIAFVINIPMKLVEKLLVKAREQLTKKKPNLKLPRFLVEGTRGIAMAITIICLLLILVMFFSFIIPRIGESFSLLFSNLDNYARRLAVYITSICNRFNIDYSVTVDEVQKWFASIDLSTILATAGNFLGNPHFKTTEFVSNVGGSFITAITSFFMALYLLANKEKHLEQGRKLIAYILGHKRAGVAFGIMSEANHYFNSFVTGQMLEALCFMLEVYIAMRLFGMPFPELIAIMAFLFSFVPMFGNFITFFAGLILVAAAQSKSMFAFAIIYLCLQQFEGNVVYPKIVGKSVGIGGLFVLLGITIFGNLWGVVGVLIGVPLTALIYAVISRIINIGLYQKHIEVTYNNLYRLDEDGNRLENKVKPKKDSSI